MASNEITIETPEPGVVVVSPVEDIDMSRSPQLRNALRGVQNDRPRKIVVDLTRVGYMDSSGLATLVEAMRSAGQNGWQLIICGLNPRVRAIFEIARLQSFFTIVPTRDEALAN